MIFRLAFKYLGVLLVLAGVVTGGYYLVTQVNTRSLTAAFEHNLEAGDYLAALGAAEALRKEGEVAPELAEKISRAARLLVAEDTFRKAQYAAKDERFADAGALLRGSTALTDPAFKYYEEAKGLYEEAEARAASLAHQTAVTISSLENQAAKEKEKRVETEAARQKLESSLMQTEQTVARKQAEIAAAEARLEASRKEADAKQAALQTEQARAQQLMLQVEKESKQKFFTELRAYRDMAQRGKELLDNAVTEINGKRDVTALIYVSQGKILFEEAKNKTGDLRANRTPSTYQAKVDDLVRALTEFLEASKQLRNAGAYIEEQGSAEFTGSLTKGKTALANGVAYLSSVTSLIASNP